MLKSQDPALANNVFVETARTIHPVLLISD